MKKMVLISVAMAAQLYAQLMVDKAEYWTLDPVPGVKVVTDVTWIGGGGGIDALGAIFESDTELNQWLADPENTAMLPLGFSFCVRGTEGAKYWWDGGNALALPNPYAIVGAHNIDPGAHDARFAKYLPLTGGEMTGGLRVSGDYVTIYSPNSTSPNRKGTVYMATGISPAEWVAGSIVAGPTLFFPGIAQGAAFGDYLVTTSMLPTVAPLTDTLMDVSRRGDFADSMRIARTNTTVNVITNFTQIVGGTITSDRFTDVVMTWNPVKNLFESSSGGKNYWFAQFNNSNKPGVDFTVFEAAGFTLESWALWAWMGGGGNELYIQDPPGITEELPPNLASNFTQSFFFGAYNNGPWYYRPWTGEVERRHLVRGTVAYEVTTNITQNVTYEPVAAIGDPVLVKDSATNITWQVYVVDGHFYATPIKENNE